MLVDTFRVAVSGALLGVTEHVADRGVEIDHQIVISGTGTRYSPVLAATSLPGRACAIPTQDDQDVTELSPDRDGIERVRRARRTTAPLLTRSNAQQPPQAPSGISAVVVAAVIV